MTLCVPDAVKPEPMRLCPCVRFRVMLIAHAVMWEILIATEMASVVACHAQPRPRSGFLVQSLVSTLLQNLLSLRQRVHQTQRCRQRKGVLYYALHGLDRIVSACGAHARHVTLLTMVVPAQTAMLPR